MRPLSRIGALVTLLVGIALVPAVEAYLKIGVQVGNNIIALRWTRFPIRYFITNRNVPGVTAQQLQQAVDRAFRTWAGVSGVTIGAEFGGFTSVEPHTDDFISVIGFRSQPDDDRTLGAATHEVDEATGQLIASDIFLNAIFEWSVAGNGEAGRFDVESIALHEIGHLLGLGHSMLGETEVQQGGGRRVLGKGAVMFPIAYGRGNIEDRTLEADDIAGIVDSYGSNASLSDLGAISGRVTLDGRGVFGAHIDAVNASTGEVVGGFSLTEDGEFVIASLKPGLYIVRVEPLDDADLDSVFGDDADVELDFRVTFYAKLVSVPAGGTSGDIEIKVRAK
jgi:hypothetical protein